MNKWLVSLTLVSAAALVAGCGEPGPKLAKAGGTITYKGQPLDAAAINVHYGDGNTATGISDAQGKFTLTYNGRNGAVPGTKLKVSVRKQSSGFEGGAAGYEGEGPPPNMGEYSMKMMDKMKTGAEKMKSGQSTGPKQELPASYADPEKSNLTVDIPPGGVEDLALILN